MRSIKFFQAGFSILLVTLFASFSTIEAQTYGGDAAAVRTTVTVPAAPVLTTSVADTGPLPAAGGNVTLTSAAVTIPNIVSVNDATVATSGGTLAVPPDANTSQSLASVNALNVGILNGIAITGNIVRSDTSCTCGSGTPVCTGSTTVTNLSITDPDGNNTLLNGVISGTATINVFAAGIVIGTVRVNEQITSPGSITVNAIHVNLTILGINTDVVVSTAHSDITCIVSVTSNRYAGRATGIRNRDRTLLGTDITTLVSDTGHLPTTGGKLNVSTVGAATPVLLLTSGTVTSNTAGGPLGAGAPPPSTDVDSDASDSTVQNLSLTVPDILPILPPLLSVNATTVQSETRCTCSLSLPTCVGDSQLVNLEIRVAGILIPVDLDFPPNQSIVLPLGLGSITINEQFILPPSPSVNPENITVNALHLRLNVLGLAVSDTVIASSFSAIDCSTAPSAAPVSLTGRVTDAYGRGLASAVVTITDMDGVSKSARTNTFGYYVLKGLVAGENYFVGASSRGLRFTPRFVSMTDNVSGFDLSPVVESPKITRNSKFRELR